MREVVLIGNEVHQVKVSHAIAMLKQLIEGEEHTQVVSGDSFEGSVLSVLGGAISDAHGHLNTVVLVNISARNKVTLELANFAHAQGIAVAAQILIYTTHNSLIWASPNLVFIFQIGLLLKA